jgi:hypothetical protein
MGKVVSLLPRLTVNRSFIQEFLSAQAPCLALGMLEQRNRHCGYWALRPEEAIPTDISDAGFRFGHALLGTSAFEVAQFTFEFYGFRVYNALVNPNSALVRAVLSRMVEVGEYYFFAIHPNGGVRAFRSEIGQEDLAGLRTTLPRMLRTTTSDRQDEQAVSAFRKNPNPPGVLLDWVCRDNVGFLDLDSDRLDLNPAYGE